jgi:hypothetical protein
VFVIFINQNYLIYRVIILMVIFMKKIFIVTFISLVALIFVNNSFADSKKIPIKEISVFKDGHVFVLHEGVVPTNDKGDVLVDYLPSPVLGTFWPYSAEPTAKLVGVSSGRRKVSIERTALDLNSLIAANIGAEVLITEKSLLNTPSEKYQATILALPNRSSEELALTSSPNDLERLAVKSNIVLLKTSNGTKVLPIEKIEDITFTNSFKAKVSEEEFRNQMTLNLDWGKQKTPQSAKVGYVYVQKAIRWIPSYRVDIDGNGNAVIKLQATLINDLADLDKVSANLIVGVPSFAFEGTIDPIAIQQTASQLSFESANVLRNNNFSISGIDNNDITRQQITRNQSIDSSTQSEGFRLDDNTSQKEDLFVFKLKDISLKKGERMVFTLSEQTLKYKDVYVVNIPFSPPSEFARDITSQQQLEIVRLMRTPKATHKLRIVNNGNYPFTTAPALVVKEGSVLSEGILTYTAIGATTDLDITKAINILVKKTDTETKRTPNAKRWNGSDYSKIDLSSSITLTNLYSQTVYLEINRYVVGSVSTVTNEGEVKNINILEDDSFLGLESVSGRYASNLPSWVYLNGASKVSWKTTLETGKKLNFDYTWHYFGLY